MSSVEHGLRGGGESRDVEEMVSKFRKKCAITIDEDEQREAKASVKNAIVLKLITDRGYNKQTFIRTMARAWKVREGDFVELAGNIFQVKLRSGVDQSRIMNGGPWNFMKQLVAIRRWEAGCVPFEYNFDRGYIWVQVHNLPSEYLEGKAAANMARKCASKLGIMKQYYCAESNQRKFLRIMVEINIRDPLLLGSEMERKGKKPLWLAFKYERLPLLCYGCGRMGHEKRFCKMPRSEEYEEDEYGSWMRAEVSDVGGDGYGSDKEVTGDSGSGGNLGNGAEGETGSKQLLGVLHGETEGEDRADTFKTVIEFQGGQPAQSLNGEKRSNNEEHSIYEAGEGSNREIMLAELRIERKRASGKFRWAKKQLY